MSKKRKIHEVHPSSKRVKYDLRLYDQGNYLYNEKKYEQALQSFVLFLECHNICDAYNYNCVEKVLYIIEYPSEKCIKWLHDNQEKSYAQYFLGEIDYTKVESDWFYKSAMQGNSYGQFGMGELYSMKGHKDKIHWSDKKGKIDNKNYRMATIWYKTSVAQDNRYAQEQLAYLCVNNKGMKKDLDYAIDLLNKSINQGQYSAQMVLSGMYRHGFDGVKVDIQKSIDLYYQIAEVGVHEALYDLAEYYFNGTQYKEDKKKALVLYHAAAEQENGEALYFFGHSHRFGNYLKQDHEKAFHFLSRSVKKGFGHRELADMYIEGIYVEKDNALIPKKDESCLNSVSETRRIAHYKIAIDLLQTERYHLNSLFEKQSIQSKKEFDLMNTTLDYSCTFPQTVREWYEMDNKYILYNRNRTKKLREVFVKPIYIPKELIEIMVSYG
jgi:TPR repeat protein